MKKLILPLIFILSSFLEARGLPPDVIRAIKDSTECSRIAPFYLELGTPDGMFFSSTIGGGLPDRATVLPIASASKWIFAGYVAEKLGIELDREVISALTMRSGFSQLSVEACMSDAIQTVEECARAAGNDQFVGEHQGRFFYNNGHYQQLAVSLGLGSFTGADLVNEFRAYLNLDEQTSMSTPLLGGGLAMSAAGFAKFLSALLSSDLMLSQLLGAHATCTFGADCPQAGLSPVEQNDQYSLGHWIEKLDGAYSSAGFFGFYPWIDAERTHYGIISRFSTDLSDNIGYGPGFTSMLCGQVIRQALRSSR